MEKLAQEFWDECEQNGVVDTKEKAIAKSLLNLRFRREVSIDKEYGAGKAIEAVRNGEYENKEQIIKEIISITTQSFY